APMLSARLFKQKTTTDHRPPTTDSSTPSSVVGGRSSEEQELLAEANEDPGALGRFYGGILRWSLRHRMLIVVLSVVVLAASGVAATQLKFAFIANIDQHQ